MQTKFFLGFINQGEIKAHLHQSSQWKDNKLFQKDLIETRFEEKDYIGFSISVPLPYSEIFTKEQELRKLIESYCPKLSLDKHKTYIFPQIYTPIT